MATPPNFPIEPLTVSSRLRELLALLADGQFHSGDAIGAAAGVSRAAIWKLIEQLRALGLTVEAIRGRGYRLMQAVELLEAELVSAELAQRYSSSLPVEVLLQCDSTNRLLLERAKAGEGSQLLATEFQTAGRGRWGRSWVAPFGSTLCLSLLWRFPVLPHGLAGLSLAVAVGVANALQEQGVAIKLKWPNDLMLNGRKLGGILIELIGEVTGPCAVVVGLGLNLDEAEQIEAAAGQPVAVLSEADAALAGQRNALLAAIAAAMEQTCERFAGEGFHAFLPQWNRYDWLADEPVLLSLPKEGVRGIARGVDAQGALLLERDGRIEARYSGDLRLRLRHDPVA